MWVICILHNGLVVCQIAPLAIFISSVAPLAEKVVDELMFFFY